MTGPAPLPLDDLLDGTLRIVLPHRDWERPASLREAKVVACAVDGEAVSLDVDSISGSFYSVLPPLIQGLQWTRSSASPAVESQEERAFRQRVGVGVYDVIHEVLSRLASPPATLARMELVGLRVVLLHERFGPADRAAALAVVRRWWPRLSGWDGTSVISDGRGDELSTRRAAEAADRDPDEDGDDDVSASPREAEAEGTDGGTPEPVGDLADTAVADDPDTDTDTDDDAEGASPA
jgi:hypothetical protein